MDWLQFTASVVGSLVWPATVIAAFFILKNYLPAIFPFVERLKYKDFEVEFLNPEGRTFALTELKRDELLVLKREPVAA